MIESKLLRAAAKLWYIKTLGLQSAVPVPRDSHDVISGTEDPDRVLLIGNGPTHGWGTLTHDLALTGQLGRALSHATGRHTDVRYVGDEMMSIATVIPWLRDTHLEEYDLVLLVLSMNDAVRLTPVDDYRRHMEALLHKLVTETKPSTRIIIAGIHDVASLPLYRGFLASIGQRCADRLNAAVRTLVGQFDGVQFISVDAPEPEPDRPYGSPGMYAQWSVTFVSTCVPALTEARALDHDRRTIRDVAPEWGWAPAEHIVDGAPADGWPELNAIVTSAQHRFGTDIAYISVIDSDQQYFVATTGANGRSVPLELTHCNVTVQGDFPVIVRNALKDERFTSSAFIELSQMRFYAGVPLKNPQGKTIGTFCVASALPRAGRDFSEDRLLDYAARAQRELQHLSTHHTALPHPADHAERT